MEGTKIPGVRILATLAASFLLSCANPPGAGPGQHPAGAGAGAAVRDPATASSAQGGMAGAAATQGAPCCGMMGGHQHAEQGGMQPKDKEAMCAAHRGMRDAPNEQARQAMMERHMQGMSPGMRQHHMEMMRQHCQ